MQLSILFKERRKIKQSNRGSEVKTLGLQRFVGFTILPPVALQERAAL